MGSLHVAARGVGDDRGRMLGVAQSKRARRTALWLVPGAGEDETIAPHRPRRKRCFWGRRGHISLFG